MKTNLRKTIYIDVDEEITSIIERIKKADAREITIVIPKRAQVIQSAINLRLLKKEAEKNRKKIGIVTQDRLGRKLLERAGILANDTNEDFSSKSIANPVQKEDQEDNISEFNGFDEEIIGSESFSSTKLSEEPFDDNRIEEVLKITKSSKKLKNNVYVAAADKDLLSKSAVLENKKASLNPKSAGKLRSVVQMIKKGKTAKHINMSDIVGTPKVLKGQKKQIDRLNAIKESVPKKIIRKEKPKSPREISEDIFKDIVLDNAVQRKAERIFQRAANSTKREEIEKILKKRITSGKIVKYFAIFFISMFLIGSVAFAYYNFSKAEITLTLRNIREPISLTIHAGSDIDSPRRSDKKIPAKKEFIENEKVYEFFSTGSSENVPSNNRATGKVVIYNQYGKDPQPLVKNTRLEGANGLIFRISSDVVVPGKETSGKPGEVTVEVFADGEGDEYQIEPTEFKIVGFKGSPKYDSFYARSFEKFVLNKEGNIQKKVTSDDILNARKKSVEAATNEGKNMLHDAVPVGRYIFDDAIDVEARIMECNAKAGDLRDKFNCQVSVKATAVSVSTDDVKSIITEEAILHGANEASKFSIEGGINYILIKEKLDEVSLDFEVKTDIYISPYIDEKNFIKGILGKKEPEVLSYISSYPGIEKGEVKFFPFFIKRVPFDESKIKLKLN